MKNRKQQIISAPLMIILSLLSVPAQAADGPEEVGSGKMPLLDRAETSNQLALSEAPTRINDGSCSKKATI